jgi:hypothetical protein
VDALAFGFLRFPKFNATYICDLRAERGARWVRQKNYQGKLSDEIKLSRVERKGQGPERQTGLVRSVTRLAERS